MKLKLSKLIYILALISIIFTGIAYTQENKCDDAHQYDGVRQYRQNPEALNDYDLYSFKLMLNEGMITEAEVFDMIANYNYLTNQGVIDLVNDGYLHSYIDDLIAVGRLPQGFVPTPVTATSETPATPQEQQPVSNTQPTCDESVTGCYIVIKEETSGYSDYNASSVKKTWIKGEETEVTGLMSNGYYRVVFDGKEQYIKTKNLVKKEDYEAAWEETNRIESTCQEEGNVTYTNSYTDETQTVVLEKLEHKFETIEKEAQTCTEDGYEKNVCSMCQTEVEETLTKLGHSEGEFETIRKASLFIDGKMESRCLTCDEIIATKNIPAKVPIVAVVVILLLTSGIGVGVYLYKRKEV